MALELDLGTNSTIEVVSSKDSALDCDQETYAEYLASLDPEHLVFKDGCGYQDTTRFVLKKNLKYDQMQRIKNQQLTVKGGNQVSFNVGYMLEEIRCALVDIKNPDDLPTDKKVPYKRDSDGACDKNLVAALEMAGIVQELWQARNGSILGEQQVEGLKKK